MNMFFSPVFTFKDSRTLRLGLDLDSKERMLSFTIKTEEQNWPLRDHFEAYLNSRMKDHYVEILKEYYLESGDREQSEFKLFLYYFLQSIDQEEFKSIESQDKGLCRCFNISEEYLQKLTDSGKANKLDDWKSLTRASYGCGSCSKDLEAFWQKNLDRSSLKEQGINSFKKEKFDELGKWISPKGMLPWDFYLFMDKELQKFNQKHNSLCQLRKIKGYEVQLDGDFSRDTLIQLEKYFLDHHDLRLFFLS
ncbi:MAG: (2Fe-2S)-binding protein [Bacteriovoracaceae bacterium]